MCQHCVTHGVDGGKWYFNAANYARRIYRIRKEEIERQGEEPSQALMAAAVIQEAVEASVLNPSQFPEIKQRAEQLSQTFHFGQVITLEEVQAIMDIAYPIARMTCLCRREMRGTPDKDNMYCMGIGVGMYKWERAAETYRGGVEFMSPAAAKQWLPEVNKMGLVHSFWTFGTPYIGGICNCEYPVCLGIRNRLDYDLNILTKGEHVAKVDYALCTGCGACVERCQFGALRREVSIDKININALRCFGCGLCATGCPNGAIAMVDRGTLPTLKDKW